MTLVRGCWAIAAQSLYNGHMGVQRDMLYAGRLQAVHSDSGSGERPPAREPFWHKLNHIPRLLNLMKYRKHQQTLDGQEPEQVDYEPIHLHVTPSEMHPVLAAIERRKLESGIPSAKSPTQELTLDNFKFLMEQVPAVRTIEFSGQRDPFCNPDAIRMLAYAHKFNGAESTIYTDGFLLDTVRDELLASPVRTLIVRMHAHRPSAYARMTGEPATRFVTLKDQVVALLAQKKAMRANLEVELQMTVDLHNFRQIPDMIAFADELGADGIRFENYLPSSSGQPSDRTLYLHQKPVVQLLRALEKTLIPVSRLHIVLPVLLSQNMSENRYCLDPFTTVSVDAQFNVSGCSRQQLYRGKVGKVWDEDFWNSEMYRWLRSVHNKKAGTAQSSSHPDVPLPCQVCPRNLSCGPR